MKSLMVQVLRSIVQARETISHTDSGLKSHLQPISLRFGAYLMNAVSKGNVSTGYITDIM
jgi:hypothetical protein